MPYISIDGVDFYRMDDYDNAYTLLISRRCEDILELTADMTKLEIGKSCDLANGVTIQFTDISVIESVDGDGLRLDYIINNNRTEALSAPISVDFNSKFYLAQSHEAMCDTVPTQLCGIIDATSGENGSSSFMLPAKADPTVTKYGMVIGALYFEMYGGSYYVDLGEYFR